MSRFNNKVALITGAASGMGKATCIRMAAEGASVFAVDINEAGLASVAEEIGNSGGTIKTQSFDVTNKAECDAIVAAAVDQFGQLDTLANVAGIVRFAKSVEMTEADWNLVMAINLNGPMFMSQAAIPHLLKTNGSIVNVASNAGLMGQAYTAAYCASKGGLVQLTRSMAMEFIKDSIRINAVCPGGTDTNMTNGIDFPKGMDFELINRYSATRGMADPADLAAIIAFLASDDAKTVHGSIFSADNGVTAG